MLKNLAAMLLACTILLGGALAEGFNQAELEQTPDCQVYQEDPGVDTVVRPMDQPYIGEIQRDNAMLITFLDYVEKPDEGMTLLRLTVSVMSGEKIAASEMAVTVGKETYVFPIAPVISEYDTTYYEDYAVCFTDESLPMLKAMARAKDGSFPVEFRSGETVCGMLALPGERAAEIYDRYIDLGGHTQNLAICRDLWPVTVVKSK